MNFFCSDRSTDEAVAEPDSVYGVASVRQQSAIALCARRGDARARQVARIYQERTEYAVRGYITDRALRLIMGLQ